VIRFAYLNADGIVVQLTSGDLTPDQHDLFLRDYGVLFGAVSCVRVEDDRAIWIGGSYTDGTFSAPPEPEPLPEVITETTI
jgi:hypothetical protein